MDKKKLVIGLGIISAGAIAIYILSQNNNVGSGIGAGSGGGTKKEDTGTETSSMPFVFNFEQPDFPMFDFSLPDPTLYDYGGTSSSGSTKKRSSSGDMASTYISEQSKPGQVGYAVGSIKQALKNAGYGGSKKDTSQNDYGIVFPPGGF